MKDPVAIQLYLSIGVAFIMVGMGLSLTVSDFVRIKENPVPVLIGLCNQLLFLPVLGLGLVYFFGLKQEYAVGLMLIAACPGGALSNLVSNLAKGDIGLSVTLTACSSLITVFTIPLIVGLSLHHFMDTSENVSLSFIETLVKMISIVAVPVFIGMIIRRKNEALAARMENPVKIISVIFIVVIVAAAVMANKGKLTTALPLVLPAVMSLNILSMLLGFFSGKLFQLNLKQRISISIESGIQNSPLALAVGVMGSLAIYPEIRLGPVIYGLLMMGSGVAAAALYARLVNVSCRQQHQVLAS